MLFVHDSGDHETAGGETLFRNDAGSGDHRRDATLHVLRAAAVQAAVALGRHKRIVHASDTHGVGVAAEHQRASLGAPLEHADDIRPAGRHRFHGHLEAEAPHRGGDGGGNFLLAWRARDERRVHGVDRDEIAQEADRWIHGKSLQPIAIAISYRLSAVSCQLSAKSIQRRPAASGTHSGTRGPSAVLRYGADERAY
jgi:hypothetical protein